MFKKILTFFLLLTILVSPFCSVIAVEDVGVESLSIAREAGIDPFASGGWFNDSSVATMGVIRNGLVKINNQSADLKEHGVSDAAIAAQRTEAVDSLKYYAKASYAQENPSVLKIWKTDDAEKGNLLKAQANFEKTIQLGYAKNGMEKEAQTGKDIVAELDAKANQYHSDSLPGSNEFTGNKTLDGLISQAITPQGKTYILLAPVETFFPGGVVDVAGGGLGTYLNNLYRIGIAIATGLCLIMIVIGGLEYVASGTVGGKSDGREKIVNAGKGLLLALCSYLILQQINPNLLRNDFNIDATKSGGTIAQVDYELTRGEQTGVLADVRSGVDVSAMPYTQNTLNNLNYSFSGSPQAQFVSTPGSRSIGGGPVAIDYDGSPGAYKVARSDSGKYTFNGVRYNSVGYEDLANAGVPGNWWGVKTNNGKTSGTPIINSDGTLIGTLSIGAGVINGDVTPFVALNQAQVNLAKSKYGVTLSPSLKTKVILTANGRSIYAIYADYAGSNGNGVNYSEVSPAAAKALNIDFGKKNGRSYASGNVAISLP